MILKICHFANRVVLVHHNFSLTAYYSFGVDWAIENSAFIFASLPANVKIELKSKFGEMVSKLADGSSKMG
jgi:hypothetical protein